MSRAAAHIAQQEKAPHTRTWLGTLASLPVLATSLWGPLEVKGGEEEEEWKEEHPQHSQVGEDGGGIGGDARLRGPQRSVPLGEDGLSGSTPLPLTSQPKLVGTAGAKEDLQGQPWVRQQELQHVGLHSNGRGQLIHVGDIIRLQCGAVPVPSGERAEEGGGLLGFPFFFLPFFFFFKHSEGKACAVLSPSKPGEWSWLGAMAPGDVHRCCC